MKVLLHIKEEEAKRSFTLLETKNNTVQKVSEEALLRWKGNHGDSVIDGILFDGDKIEVPDPERYTGNQMYLVSMLGESRRDLGKKPKIIGYKMYVPSEGKIKCYPTASAVELAKSNGVLNGEIEEYNGTEFIHAKVKTEPAEKHVGLYLQMYHRRKAKAQEQGRVCEKIVRVDTENLELRSMPAGKFEKLQTPNGVGFINIKYWKLIGPKHMAFKDRPQVRELTIGKSVKEIKYNEPANNMDLIPAEISLGAFAGWGLERVIMGSGLEVIGKEAFANNKLKSVEIGPRVKVIGENAFKGNPISKIEFTSCNGMRPLLRIEERAFTNLPFGEGSYLKLPAVKFIGRNAFNGSKIESVSFGAGTTVKMITSGSFANTRIEEFWVPDSVEVIYPGAFTGTPIKKLIFGKGSRIKYISKKAFDDGYVKIIGTQVGLSTGPIPQPSQVKPKTNTGNNRHNNKGNGNKGNGNKGNGNKGRLATGQQRGCRPTHKK